MRSHLTNTAFLLCLNHQHRAQAFRHALSPKAVLPDKKERSESLGVARTDEWLRFLATLREP